MAACLWQRDGFCPDAVELEVPGGKVYRPDIVPHEDGSCGIYKDSGDDPDITNGMEIVSRVELLDGDGPVTFCAGDGVGDEAEAVFYDIADKEVRIRRPCRVGQNSRPEICVVHGDTFFHLF